MASIQRRGNVWRAQVARLGKRVNGTFDTHREAQAWAISAEAAILAGATVAQALTGGTATAADLFRRYAAEVSPSKRGGRWEALRLAKLAKDPIFNRPADQIDGALLSEWRNARSLLVSSSSVNRERSLLSSVFTTARKEWRIPVKVNPTRDVKWAKMPNPRTRRINPKERDRLVAALGWDTINCPATVSQWTAFAFCLALETAMRKGEILSIVWGDVHLADRFVHLENTKNGYSRDVPLSSAALALFGRLVTGKEREKVVRVGSGTMDIVMRKAREATGLLDIHFHDSRREATTNMAAILSNVLELSVVTGHRDINLLRRVYYSPSATELAKKLG